MEEDIYTEVTSESWFGRIGNSLAGILIGFVLIAGSTGVLFWNEGRTVKEYKSLKEGASLVVSANSDDVSHENEGQLVHMTGLATTDEILRDTRFPVSANAISLKRTAKMYQWKETSSTKKKKKLGGGEESVKTYKYSKTWSSTLIDSSRFKKTDSHRNPGSMMFKSTTINAKNVNLGAFNLSRGQIRKIKAYESLPVTNMSEVPDVDKPVSISTGDIYIGNDQNTPEIGDISISFAIVPPTEITLVSQQAGKSFTPFITSVGGNIDELEAGTFTASAMFEKAQSKNTMIGWIIRLVGFILTIVGFSLLFKPLSVLADVVPFLGNIVEFGTGIIAFLLSLMLSFTTIAVAWIFYRPLIGVSLLAVTAGIFIYILTAKKGKSSVRQGVRQPLVQKRRGHSSRDEAFGNGEEAAVSSKKQTIEDPFLTGDD